uniref:H-type lectin domain-containing protein n=1 Tax=Branchiostoma floridae TaxID=7739 RepID=C3XSZ0_BRAFL|eukprot:XP_002612849.1 hypothetical protein BRAFLDRAFT_67201 [Branchiostoma floridae]
MDSYEADVQQLQAEIIAKEKMFQAKMHQLQTEMTAKEQMFQAEIQQLQTEMAAKDNRTHVEDMEQRDYVERCESGNLETPKKKKASLFPPGYGNRYHDLTATFSRAFRKTPVVTVGLTNVDHYPGHIRVSARVTSVTKTALTVQIGTWHNSEMYQAKVRWMACA